MNKKSLIGLFCISLLSAVLLVSVINYYQDDGTAINEPIKSPTTIDNPTPIQTSTGFSQISNDDIMNDTQIPREKNIIRNLKGGNYEE